MSKGLNARRLRSMLVKEAVQIGRDPATFVVAFVLPVILMLLMGFGINLDMNRVPIGLSLQSDSAAARSLAAAYQHSRYFDVVAVGPAERLKAEMERGRIRGIVIVPAGFGRTGSTGANQAQLLTDGSYPNPAKFLETYARGVQVTWATSQALDRGMAMQAPIAIDSRFWFNSTASSRNFLVPGSIAVVMTIVGCLLTALVIAREWESGTLEALLSTPLGITEFLLSKLLPYLLLGMGSMAICILMAVLVFGVPLRGSPLAVTLVAFVYLLPALGLGLLISAALRNQFVASQLALILAFLPSLFLSGFVYEIASMPRPIQLLSVLVPARYFVPQLLTVFLVGDDWAALLPNMAVLIAFAAGALLLCRLLTRRSLG